jgi:superkiller protein 3
MILSPDEIIKKGQKCLKEGRCAPSALSAIGMAYFDKGLLDKAEFYYLKALEQDTQFAPAYAGLGIVYGRKGLVTESVFNFKEAVRLSPNCALLYNWLGDAYFDQGKMEEAIREYTRATELDGMDSNAHNDLADAYRKKGDLPTALEYYRKTLVIDPGDTNAKLELAQVLVLLERKAEARPLLEELITSFPDTQDAKTAKVVLAGLMTQEGDFPAARTFFQQASTDFPFNPTIQFQLGLCELIVGDREAALDHFQKTLDLDPNNIRATRLIQRIRKKGGGA